MTTLICPACANRHTRRPGNTRTIFCHCGSAAIYAYSQDVWNWYWYWFRIGSMKKAALEPETQTESRQIHGPEIDL